MLLDTCPLGSGKWISGIRHQPFPAESCLFPPPFLLPERLRRAYVSHADNSTIVSNFCQAPESDPNPRLRNADNREIGRNTTPTPKLAAEASGLFAYFACFAVKKSPGGNSGGCWPGPITEQTLADKTVLRKEKSMGQVLV